MSRASRIVAKVDALRYTVRVLLYCSNAPTKTTVELELGIVIRSGVWKLESPESGGVDAVQSRIRIDFSANGINSKYYTGWFTVFYIVPEGTRRTVYISFLSRGFTSCRLPFAGILSVCREIGRASQEEISSVRCIHMSHRPEPSAKQI